MDKKNVYLEQIQPARMAYVRQTGPYGPSNIQTMEKLKRWADQNKLLNEDAVLFGIPQDHPAAVLPQLCRYDACIVIEDHFHLDKDISKDTGFEINVGRFPGGNYLIFTVPHTAEGIQNAWNDMIPRLQAEGYRMDNKPVIERYRPQLLNQHLCELCVPVTTQ